MLNNESREEIRAKWSKRKTLEVALGGIKSRKIQWMGCNSQPNQHLLITLAKGFESQPLTRRSDIQLVLFVICSTNRLLLVLFNFRKNLLDQ